MGVLEPPDKKTRSINVAARPSDPKMFRAQKGNKVIYLRRTAPEPQGLTPLAAFLVENVDSCVVSELNDQTAKPVLLIAEGLKRKSCVNASQDATPRLLSAPMGSTGNWPRWENGNFW